MNCDSSPYRQDFSGFKDNEFVYSSYLYSGSSLLSMTQVICLAHRSLA